MSSLFDFDAKADEYAVMGNPISHSKSPLIHQAFAQQTKQLVHYTAIHVDLGGFAQAVGNFFANKGKGLNITVPFKHDALEIADTSSDAAGLAGAANTLLINEQGILVADNTDGIGLVRDLTNNHNRIIKGQSILLIGAGGAARGVILPLLNEKPTQLTIVNRTPAKAQQLVDIFSKFGPVKGIDFDNLSNLDFDIVINATSASLQGKLPPLETTIFAPQSLSYDMMYGAQDTIFQSWSSQHGASDCLDGLGMLVEQAAASFYLWRNVRPETTDVIKQIRETLS
jgi:shikimate dehydrogenase